MRSIGRYEIQGEIGRGAMGVVYLAHDPRLHRQVAVKTYALPEGISEELKQEFHERFLREARLAASLSHPGIVTIHDAGEDPAQSIPYIAMEYVRGRSLKKLLEKGQPLDPTWVFTFGAVLADALQVAHRAGIVHRDIKPANILIRDEDRVAKIADFGVARLKASDLTRTGASLGSPGYMSPEQVRSGALDGRSDLFSLAVVLYEALCGKRPFHGDDLVSLAYSIAHDTQVPLSRQLQGCPAGLDEFFNRALSKDPDKRFPDGAAFREAFVDAGRRRSSHAAGGTVLDAATVKMASAAIQPFRADPGESPRLSAPGPGNHLRRRRLLGLKIASVALLSISLAAAAYLHLAGPPPLAAVEREIGASRSSTASASRQVSPQVKEARRKNPPPAERSQEPRLIRVRVPSGTEIHLTLNSPVGSSTNRAGDPFTARITDPVVAGDRVAIPAGSSVHGHVLQAVPAKKGLSEKAGSLSLSFDRVATPAGSGASMSAVWTRVAPQSARKNAGIIGGSAAGGALLGKVLGGSTKDAMVGAAAGGAIGTGIAAGTRGRDVEIPTGSPLTIKLDQPLTLSIKP